MIKTNNSSRIAKVVGAGLAAGLGVFLFASFAMAQSTTSTVAALQVANDVNTMSPAEGDTVNYTIAVSALGPATSPGVTVDDMLPVGLTFVDATASQGSYDSPSGVWTVGDMASGTTATLDLAAQVASGTAGQTITNTATVNESSSVTNPNEDVSSANFTVMTPTSTPTSSPDAALTISDTANSSTFMPGDTVTYAVTVGAEGPATSTGVTVSDMLPAGLTFADATASQGSYDSPSGVWTVGDMMSGSTAILTVDATVDASDTAGQSITNTATVNESASSTNPNASSLSAMATFAVVSPTTTPTSTPTSTPTAGLTVGNAFDMTSPQAGSAVNNTVTITADGPATSTGVSVSDILPAGLTFADATASQGTYDSSTGVWTIGDMTPSSTAMLTLGATVDASDTAGQVITDTATASESSSVMNPNPGTATVALTITAASTTPTSTPTSTTSLAVGCDWSITGNTVTWVANATGGTAPYTYAWTGTDGLSATGSTATMTYPNTGAYFATVTAADAASDTASNECSVSILSGGSGGMPTSTPPVVLPSTLTIRPNGSVTADEMLVTGVSSGSFTGQIWGITFMVNTTGARITMPRNSTGTIATGDHVAVDGTLSSSTVPLTIDATRVTDRNGGIFGGGFRK